MKNNELIVNESVLIDTDPTKIWDAITNSEMTQKYMYNSLVISDWKVGDQIIWKSAVDGKIYVIGKILIIIPERLLQTSDFNPNIGLQDVPNNRTTVTYELKKTKSSTILAITENNFNGDVTRYKDSIKFWHTVLNKLKQVLEGKE